MKLLHHPVVGDLDLSFESFPVGGEPSQNLLTYTAEPESPSQDALNLLAGWAATTGSRGTDSRGTSATNDTSIQAESSSETSD